MNADSLPEGWSHLLDELAARRDRAYEQGGSARIERERRHGRGTARERIERLVDMDTFHEFGTFVTTPLDDGTRAPSTLICGMAQIDGRPVAVAAEDFTVQGGGVGVHLKRYKGAWGGFIEEFAYAYEIPLVMLLQGVGGSVTLQEEKGFPELVSTNSAFPVFELLGRVPVVAAVLGPTAGSSAARATISHFSVMSRSNGCLFAGGPPLVKQALGLDIDKFELGGADIHTRVSGLIDNAVDDEEQALAAVRQFLGYLPSNTTMLPPVHTPEDPVDRACDEVLEIVEPNARRAYDPTRLVRAVMDVGTVMEVSPDFGRAVCTALARIGGLPVGVIATDPRHLAGALDAPASEKQTRFVELCDTFHLPIVYFVDVPGFMIGPDAEASGVLRKGARAIQAIHRATVPVITVQVRRSYGLAGLATGNPGARSVRLAWPSGSWGDLPVAGGVEAEYRAEIESSPDPAAKRAELIARLADQTSPWRTVEKFGLEEMIDPRDTRRRVASLVDLHFRTARPAPKQGPQVRP